MLIECNTGSSAEVEAQHTVYLDGVTTAARYLCKDLLENSAKRKFKRMEGRKKIEIDSDPEKLAKYIEDTLKEDSVYLEVFEGRKQLCWCNLHVLPVLTEADV